MNNKLEELKQQRKILNTMNTICHGLIGFILFITCILLFFGLTSNNLPTWAIISFVSSIGLLGIIVSIWEKLKNEYRKIFKEIVVKTALNNCLDNYSYIQSSGFPKSYIESIDILKKGNIYESFDYIEGDYKGTKFKQADVEIQNKDSKDNAVSTIFNGRWSVLTFNDSLSKVIKEEYQNYELTNSELSFATGGKKESYRKISKDKYNM